MFLHTEKKGFLMISLKLRLLMGKPTICIGENKDADQLRGNREADQRLCFRYTDSTIPLLSISKISSLCPSSVLVQPGLCQTCSETILLVFPQGGSTVRVLPGSAIFCLSSSILCISDSLGEWITITVEPRIQHAHPTLPSRFRRSFRK